MSGFDRGRGDTLRRAELYLLLTVTRVVRARIRDRMSLETNKLTREIDEADAQALDEALAPFGLGPELDGAQPNADAAIASDGSVECGLCDRECADPQIVAAVAERGAADPLWLERGVLLCPACAAITGEGDGLAWVLGDPQPRVEHVKILR